MSIQRCAIDMGKIFSNFLTFHGLQIHIFSVNFSNFGVGQLMIPNWPTFVNKQKVYEVIYRS